MEQSPLVLDVETTIFAKGNPFSERNKLCYVGTLCSATNAYLLYDIQYSASPYGSSLTEIQSLVSSSNLLIGFNLKFDLHWIRKYGIDFSHCKIWDCQLVHFILSNQKAILPSLNEVAEHYGLGKKLDVVEEEYWNKNINTPDIPQDILEEYLEQDLHLTYQIYLKQVEEVKELPVARQRLISLHNQDLLVLEEMEYNGLLYNEDKCTKLAEADQLLLDNYDEDLRSMFPIDGINFDSGDQLSCMLYGGTITIPYQEVVGVYKTGARAGQEKLGWKEHEYILPRLFTPPKGSALKKEGYFSTDEQTIKSLKGNKKFLDILLNRSTIEKRVGTYYRGIPKLRMEMDWPKNMLHGQLNQCIARTGRLSSSKPNLQNIDGNIKDLFYTRY